MAIKLIRISTSRRFFLITAYLFGLLGIVASGGGGSSSDSTGISYTGNRDPALITSFNAARLVENIVVGQSILGSSSGGVVRSDISIDKPPPALV